MFAEASERDRSRPQRSLRIAPYPTDVARSRPHTRYRLRQNPPMSRERAFLSNFEGVWFVTQFLPITPQPVIFLHSPLVAYPSLLTPVKPAKVCGLRRRYHL